MGQNLRFTAEQLEEFEKKRRKWEREGKATVRENKLVDEPDTKAKAATQKKKSQATSELEELAAQQILLLKLPPPKREFRHIVGRDFRLDFAWPQKKVGLEIQGMVHRIKDRFKSDVEKRALGLLSGWRVLEVDGGTLRSGQAMRWIEELLA